MGRSYTPKYAVHFAVDRGYWTPMGWNSRQSGRPTAANLAKFVKGYEDSTRPGGCNNHIGPTRILSARIVLNDGTQGTVVAEYRS